MKIRTLIPFILLLIISCNNEKDIFKVTEGQVKINGVINNYDGSYKTGQLIYFDAITRTEKNKIIIIDTTGTFSVSFPLIHPILGSTFIEFENNVYYDFYIEPNQKYDAIISGDRITFHGETGIINREIVEFNDSLYSGSGSEIEKMYNSISNDLPLNDYKSKNKDYENTRLNFLSDYSKRHNLSEKVRILLANEIRYKTANSLIMYLNNKNNASRDSLPEYLYTNLFTEYTVLNQDEFENRNCNDYIGSIVSILEKKDNVIENRMEFISSVNFFTPEELEFLSKLYSKNPNEQKTTEYKDFYKKFFTNSNMSMLAELFYKYNFQNVLNNLSLFNESLGRDLIITQAFSRNYINKSITPTQEEWNKIDSLINNESIRNYIHSILVIGKSKNDKTQAKDTITFNMVEQVKEKYLDKYLGKVIYIDFYATWCGPCIAEIPFAQELHHAFKSSDVVFLNLCAKSSEENWKTLLENKNIMGENYLLSDDEYVLLSKLFEIKGLPTYAIVDKNGDIVSLKASRPSSKKIVVDEINKLL